MARVARHGLSGAIYPGPWYCVWCSRRKQGKRMRCKCGRPGGWLRNWITKPEGVR